MSAGTLDTTSVVSRPGWRGAAAYVLMLVGAVGLFFLIRHVGEGLIAPDALPGTVSVVAPLAGQVDVVAHVLATLAAIVGLGYVLGRLCVRIGQPPAERSTRRLEL